MKQNVSKQTASRLEVEQALSSLSDAQVLKLLRFAEFRIKGLGRKSMGRTGEDLLQEAIIRALEGIRNWPKASVDLYGFLLGVVRSISDSWSKVPDPVEAVSRSDLIRISDEGDPVDPLVNVASTQASPEDEVIREQDRLRAKQDVQNIEKMFKDDQMVREIIGGLQAEFSGPDIQEAMGISKTQYETALKRMRRKVRKERERS